LLVMEGVLLAESLYPDYYVGIAHAWEWGVMKETFRGAPEQPARRARAR